MGRQSILTAGRRNCSRKVVPVSGRRACRGPTSVCRREEPVATSTWRRRSFMDLRFDLSSGRPVAAGLAVAGLGGGEHFAARQQCLTKQGSPDPGQPAEGGPGPWLVAWTSCSGLQNSARDYILVIEAICPNRKLIAGVSALILRQPFQRRFA